MTKSILAMPMFDPDQNIVGVLQVLNKGSDCFDETNTDADPNGFNDMDERLLESAACLTSTMILMDQVTEHDAKVSDSFVCMAAQ